MRGVLSVPPWRRGDLAIQPGRKLVPAELARNPVQSRALSSCDHVGSRSELKDDPALCVDAGNPQDLERGGRAIVVRTTTDDPIPASSFLVGMKAS